MYDNQMIAKNSPVDHKMVCYQVRLIAKRIKEAREVANDRILKQVTIGSADSKVFLIDVTLQTVERWQVLIRRPHLSSQRNSKHDRKRWLHKSNQIQQARSRRVLEGNA